MATEQKKKGVIFGVTSKIEKEGLKHTGETITNVSIAGFPKKHMATAAFAIKKEVDDMVNKKYFHPDAISQLSVDTSGEYPGLRLISPNDEMVVIAKKAIESVDFEKVAAAVEEQTAPKEKSIVLGQSFVIDRENHEHKGQFKIDGNIAGFSKYEMGSAAYHLAQELRGQNIPGVLAISNYKTDDGFHKLNFRIKDEGAIQNVRAAIESVDFEKVAAAVKEDMQERFEKKDESIEDMQKKIQEHTDAITKLNQKVFDKEQEQANNAEQEEESTATAAQ